MRPQPSETNREGSRHLVQGPTHGVGDKVINHDCINNQACRFPQNTYIVVYLFVASDDRLFELFWKTSFVNKLSEPSENVPSRACADSECLDQTARMRSLIWVPHRLITVHCQIVYSVSMESKCPDKTLRRRRTHSAYARRHFITCHGQYMITTTLFAITLPHTQFYKSTFIIIISSHQDPTSAWNITLTGAERVSAPYPDLECQYDNHLKQNRDM